MPIDDHIVKACSFIGLYWTFLSALYVESIVSSCLPNLIENKTLSMILGMILDALAAVLSICLFMFFLFVYDVSRLPCVWNDASAKSKCV